ncbi:hypothetical protein DFR50_14242 [Roseiarcus fermentans]|uniref:Major tropism determinant N-terminal domain-containing protein n=1 Tax=Roseiarcus fermentans TaxID=1473586 RepID=A0A366ENE3_9HYPH|nr:hypothetical protein [Roseiarcus fermentans]RBP03794.1 hypothetical protein DFR50_14242 [Roseiarcus fermentans]
MSEQLQLRRGTAASVATFTPAQGELAVDTTYYKLYVGDGATAGGWSVAMAQRRALAASGTTILGTDRIIAHTTLSGAVTDTLPAASAFPVGERLLVIDESGSCSTTNTITVQRAGSDTIGGGVTSIAVNVPYGFLALESNGSNAWTVTDSFLAAQAPHGASMQFAVLEITSGALSGALVTLSNVVPANCIVFSVGAYVTTTITGATSYSVGWNGPGGSSSTFGSGLSLPAGSANYGLIGPTANYSLANLTLTPAGGNFTAGAVRLSIHLAFCNPSSS